MKRRTSTTANETWFEAGIRERAWAVKDPLSPVDWARVNLSLQPGLNAVPGPFEPWPFQIEPLEAIQDPSLSSLTLCWASQVLGKSQLLAILIGWAISEAPCGIVMIHPTLEAGQHWSRTKLAPMLRDTEALRRLVMPATGRRQAESSGSNTVMLKLFVNGFLVIVGSNSPAGLASHTARIVIADELDRLDVGGSEGDPLAIASRRSETFSNAFRVCVSTPTIRGASRIESELLQSDSRKWHIPCLACEKPFVLEWQHIKWDKDAAGNHLPKTARVECPHCLERLSDANRITMVQRGQWIPSNPDAERQHRGYWLNAFSTLLPCHQAYENRLHQWASEWLSVQAKGLQSIKTFVNTVFCEGWEEENTAVEKPELVWARREGCSCDCPDPADIKLDEKVRLITVGVDVQTDRLELETVGWSAGLESWSLDYRILRGNLNQTAVWGELAGYLQTKFRHPWGGTLPVAGVGIDTGGHYTQRVYQFMATRPLPNTFGIKGKGAVGRKWLERSETVRGLYVIAVDVLKRTLYDQLAITVPGDGYVHIPASRDYLWVEQLTSEKCINRKINGVVVPRFELPPNRHNEALDARVYARAVVEILQPAWNKIEQRFMTQRAEQAAATEAPKVERLKPEAVTTEKVEPAQAPSQRPGPRFRPTGVHPLQRPRTGWMSRL
jgi:phage terminase large subunit GpA-like protein